ncbi:hypothetical protein V8F20_012757 [Naviculisporaceae sp. PSN 640]
MVSSRFLPVGHGACRNSPHSGWRAACESPFLFELASICFGYSISVSFHRLLVFFSTSRTWYPLLIDSYSNLCISVCASFEIPQTWEPAPQPFPAPFCTCKVLSSQGQVHDLRIEEKPTRPPPLRAGQALGSTRKKKVSYRILFASPESIAVQWFCCGVGDDRSERQKEGTPCGLFFFFPCPCSTRPVELSWSNNRGLFLLYRSIGCCVSQLLVHQQQHQQPTSILSNSGFRVLFVRLFACNFPDQPPASVPLSLRTP